MSSGQSKLTHIAYKVTAAARGHKFARKMTFCCVKCFKAIVQDTCTVAYYITAWFIKLSNSGIKHLRFKEKAQNGAKCLELFIPELLSCRFYRCPVRFSSRCLEILNEPQCQETYLSTCAPNEYSDQPSHWSSLTKIFTVSILDSQGCKVSSCGLWRLIRLRECAGWFESSFAHMSEGTFPHVAVHTFL